MSNAVHPSEAPDVNDGICSTPVGKYSSPSEAPDLHDRICCALEGAPDVLYMIVSTIHLMANVVHPSEALDVR